MPQHSVICEQGIKLVRSRQFASAAQGVNARADTRFCDRTTLVSIFLGIDGGGSKTTCIIGDENSVLGTGTSVGSNVVRVGETQARKSLGNAVRAACAEAKIIPTQIKKTCVGIAGGARPEIANVVRRLLLELVGGEIEIVGDQVIAMEAAFGDGPGVIVIAGTGSIAYGRNPSGKLARAGGWGFAISDEGSGHWIGRAAVKASLRAYDQAGHDSTSPLLEGIMTFWGVTLVEQLVVMANSSPDFSALLPTVLSATGAGDEVARSVLTQAGSELVALAAIVIDRLLKKDEPTPVAVSGGVFYNSVLVREIFDKHIRHAYPQALLKHEVIDPASGALALARKNI
jgi:N-acetylglucosamine kinase-like BadF-type ATPase